MRNKGKLLASLLSLSAVSCATHPPNVEVCYELRASRKGQCHWTIEGKDRQIPAYVWDKEKRKRFSVTPKDYGKIRAFIEESCKRNKKCKLGDE